jgi:NTP pyrophosphatase (non-canonical NTP hydrolase)
MNNLQKEVKKVSKKGGFDLETLPQKFMLLTEEVGEFAKSVRKTVGIKTHTHSKEHDPKGEASDVLFVLLDICNKLNINLDKEFKKKLKQILTYKS